MNEAWKDDEDTIQAIDDAILALSHHVDDVLSKLHPFKTLPAAEPDILLFGVVGPYVMHYAHARHNGEVPTDAHHRGVAAILGDPAVNAVLQSMASRGMDALINRRRSLE